MTVFVDTHVLVYVRDARDGEKQRRAAEWMAALWDSGAGRLSYQVLHEYYVTMTTKLDPGRPAEDVRDDIGALMTWQPVSSNARILEDAWAIQDRYGFAWRDALVVGSARSIGARYLLTEDFQAGQVLGSLTIIDPFHSSPDEFL